MKGIGGVGVGRGPVSIAFGLAEVGVKHNVSAMPCGPADCFWIPPALMADDNAEPQGTGLKDMAT